MPYFFKEVRIEMNEIQKRILITMYEEEKKEYPNMALINWDTFNLDSRIFAEELKKLESNDLIHGVVMLKVLDFTHVVGARLDGARLTSSGVKFVKENLIK